MRAPWARTCQPAAGMFAPGGGGPSPPAAGMFASLREAFAPLQGAFAPLRRRRGAFAPLRGAVCPLFPRLRRGIIAGQLVVAIDIANIRIGRSIQKDLLVKSICRGPGTRTRTDHVD
eukprot:21957-Rhodomonas_salina.1